MGKKILSFLLMSLLLVEGISMVVATTTKKDVTVTYTTDRLLSIVGTNEVIAGTKGHLYKSYLDDMEAEVVWEIQGATSKKTKIDRTGSLQVGIDETAKNIEVIAKLTIHPNKQQRKTVAIKEKTYTIISVEKKPDIELEYGVKESTVQEILDSYHIFTVMIETNDGKQYEIEIDTIYYRTKEKVVTKEGIIKTGTFDVIYTLVLPRIDIDYDGSISLDKTKRSTMLEEVNSLVKVRITGSEEKENVKEIEAVKEIEGPTTGDTTSIGWWILIGGLSGSVFVVMKVRSDKERTVQA